MQQQINPWTVYDRSFKFTLPIKTTTVEQKQQKTQSNQSSTLKRVHMSKTIDNRRATPKRLMTQPLINDEKLSDMRISIYQKQYPHLRYQLRPLEKQTTKALQKQRNKINKILQQNTILKIIGSELSRSNKPLPYLRNNFKKRTPILRMTQRMLSKPEIYQSNSEKVFNQESKFQSERTANILQNSFDDTDILRRGIELIMKRKQNTSRIENIFSNRFHR